MPNVYTVHIETSKAARLCWNILQSLQGERDGQNMQVKTTQLLECVYVGALRHMMVNLPAGIKALIKVLVTLHEKQFEATL